MTMQEPPINTHIHIHTYIGTLKCTCTYVRVHSKSCSSATLDNQNAILNRVNRIYSLLWRKHTHTQQRNGWVKFFSFSSSAAFSNLVWPPANEVIQYVCLSVLLLMSFGPCNQQRCPVAPLNRYYLCSKQSIKDGQDCSS